MEDAPAIRPLSVKAACFEESISFLEEEMVFD
jgi:hypothetical protein